MNKTRIFLSPLLSRQYGIATFFSVPQRPTLPIGWRVERVITVTFCVVTTKLLCNGSEILSIFTWLLKLEIQVKCYTSSSNKLGFITSSIVDVQKKLFPQKSNLKMFLVLGPHFMLMFSGKMFTICLSEWQLRTCVRGILNCS